MFSTVIQIFFRVCNWTEGFKIYGRASIFKGIQNVLNPLLEIAQGDPVKVLKAPLSYVLLTVTKLFELFRCSLFRSTELFVVLGTNPYTMIYVIYISPYHIHCFSKSVSSTLPISWDVYVIDNKHKKISIYQAKKLHSLLQIVRLDVDQIIVLYQGRSKDILQIKCGVFVKVVMGTVLSFIKPM